MQSNMSFFMLLLGCLYDFSPSNKGFTLKLKTECRNFYFAQKAILKEKDLNNVVHLKKYKTMSKGNDSKVKSDKKVPAKSLKEKRAAKAVKRKEKKSE